MASIHTNEGWWDAFLLDALETATSALDGVNAGIVEPIDGSLTVADLTASSCRWPSGDPRDLETFRYCGETVHGGTYCERHARIAYMPRSHRPALYAIADRQGWLVGETLEHALAALQRELARG